MWHMTYSHLCTYNKKNESVLQFDPMQVNDRKGSGQPRATQGQIFELVFPNKRCVFWDQFDLSILKMSILFLCDV